LHGNNPEPLMSAKGQKQTSDWRLPMSALPPKAEIVRHGKNWWYSITSSAIAIPPVNSAVV
jgi:hypothetical protein